MKSIYKILAPIFATTLAINLVSASMLIIMLTIGIETGAWAFWFVTLFSGFIVLLTAIVASISFLLELGNIGYQKLMASIQHQLPHHLSHRH